MPKSKKNKYYAVAQGRVPGIYLTWPEAEKQVGCVILSFDHPLQTFCP